MAGKFCSNCGAPLEDTAKYCPGCGTQAPQPQQTQPVQQQPFQQYPPPYAPVPAPKPKSKAPLIVGGIAGVLVVALVIALVVTKGFGLLGKQGETGGGTAITVPKDASDEEKLAYSYIELAVEFYEGAAKIEPGFPYCADSFYSIAAVEVCAMRYAVDCLLELKGTPPAVDGRLRDWDEIAALGWISPSPYFFEGIVLEARGDNAGASECYRKAALNPNYTAEYEVLKAIKSFDDKALNSLKTVLEETEDKIFEATYGPRIVFIERNENNFDLSYLRKKAAEHMASQDAADAYAYYLAALYIDPLDGNCYADLAELGLQYFGAEMADTHLKAGLLVDPTNTRLALLTKEIEEAPKQ